MAAERTTHELDGPELVAIECPLQLKPKTEHSKVQAGSAYDGLIDRLGGLSLLSSQLAERDPNRPVELTLVKSSTNDFVQPVSGEWVQTNNILVKLIKRTRKPKNRPTGSTITPPTPIDHTDHDVRLFKIEPVGVIPLTVRFRALADYQYTPDLKHPINALARDMRSLNFEGVLKFRFEVETEDYSSAKIGLFPPPLFSRYLVPQLYNYRQNVPTVVTQTPDGSQRLINRTRYVPMGPQTITYEQPDVPQGPLARDLDHQKPDNEELFQKFLSNKVVLALYCYLFSDGPFRELLIKFGYDPRLNPEARFFQRISLRNVDRKEAKDKITLKLLKKPTRVDSADASTSDNLRDHIFDGLELRQSIGTYQLCDITDPLLISLINSPKGVLPKCNLRTGWYTSNAIEQIRSILRRKFHALLDEQRVVKDIECVDLLDIDISQDAVDLLKKHAPVHRKFKASGPNTDSQPDQEPADGDVDSSEVHTSSSRRRKPANSKPRHPNPLLKVRREKQRVKAKAIEKRVAFTEPSGRDVRIPNPSTSQGPKAQAEVLVTNRTAIAEPGERNGSDAEGEPEGDDEEGEVDEEDFFREDEDESQDDGEDHDDDYEDESSSLSDLSNLSDLSI